MIESMNVRPAGWIGLGMVAAFGVMAGVVTFLGGRVFADDATVVANSDIVVRLRARATTITPATVSLGINTTDVGAPDLAATQSESALAQLAQSAQDIRSGLLSVFGNRGAPSSHPASTRVARTPETEPGATREFVRVPTLAPSSTVDNHPTTTPVPSSTAPNVTTQPDQNHEGGGKGPAPTSSPRLQPTSTPRPQPSPTNTPRPRVTSRPNPDPTHVPEPTQKPDPTQQADPTESPLQKG